MGPTVVGVTDVGLGVGRPLSSDGVGRAVFWHNFTPEPLSKHAACALLQRGSSKHVALLSQFHGAAVDVMSNRYRAPQPVSTLSRLFGSSPRKPLLRKRTSVMRLTPCTISQVTN